MRNSVIKVENLGKMYIINHKKQERYTALRDVLVEKFKSFGKKMAFKNEKEEFWALKDISFEIKQGERLGIIGHNGAGKSTLLKVLSRITEPTGGRIKIKGRVASLLEVGTGFHPELTGRENIYLNGAILGMSKAEIKKKFGEIVEFAEVENFLDTPVKRYSSGMYVRLAFAVAANLEPEILIVDEVLAVGDAQFQKKCLGKMSNIAHEGRTVLFVSHNMQAIRQLCDRGILLNSGTIIADDTSSNVIDMYLKNAAITDNNLRLDEIICNIPPDSAFRLEGISITQNDENIVKFVQNGFPLNIEFRYKVLQKTTGLRIYFDICDTDGNLLFRSFNDEDNDGIPTVLAGDYISKAIIPSDILSPINYEINIYFTIYNIRWCEPVNGIKIPISVERTGRANRAYLGEPIRGKLAPLIPWETKKIN